MDVDLGHFDSHRGGYARLMPPVSALYRVEPDTPVSLADQNPADSGSYDDPDEARAEVRRLNERIADLQARLYAEEQRSLLVVLQGIDAAGKDSSVAHVFRGTNPQGVRVYTFKEPSNEEAAHDFLWRYHQHTPAKGMIHVFNRSHYEDVLVVRVKGLVEEERWRSRYDSINDFERMLAREGTTIVKFFLHNWDAYQEAYEEALRCTSSEWAPWYMVPSDHKWYRNLVVAQTVASVLEEMDPQWPEPEEDLEKFASEELDQLSSR
jgi:polyphosphate kinase 2 (PPK2 family)